MSTNKQLFTPAITSSTEVITPAIAAKLMQKNTINRPMNSFNLARLKKQLQQGEWKLNGESIKISPTGTILDGQHRLQACVESGISFTTIVMQNVPEDSFLTIDTGRTRCAADALSIAKEKSTHVLAAGVRTAMLLERGTFTNQERVSNSEIFDYLEKNPEIRQFVQKGSNTKVLCGATVYCGVRYLTWKSNPEKSKQFFTMFETGEGIPEKSPVKALRDRYMTNLGSSAKLNTTDMIALAIKAWNSFVAGKTLVSLRFSRSDEQFPVIK